MSHLHPHPFAVAWFVLRRRIRDHAWAAREAMSHYRAALDYCAECNAEADAHEEAEHRAALADRPRRLAVSLDDLDALEALFDAAWVWKRTPAGHADTPEAERLRAAFARAENTYVARNNFIPF